MILLESSYPFINELAARTRHARLVSGHFTHFRGTFFYRATVDRYKITRICEKISRLSRTFGKSTTAVATSVDEVTSDDKLKK